VLRQLWIPAVGPQQEEHWLDGQRRRAGGDEEEVQPGRAATQLQNVAFLQHTEARDTLSSI